MEQARPDRPRRAPDQRRRDVRRRRLGALAAVALVALALGVAAGAGGGGDTRTAGSRGPATALPRGGHTLLPAYRVVAYYGAPQDVELGALGRGSPASATRRLRRQARGYDRPGRPAMPALELIAAIANEDAGDDGLYRTRQRDRTIRRYLRAARRIKGLLVLDVQPGRANFVDEVRSLRRWLSEPDVGLALDPEWRMRAGEIPGDTIGSVDAGEVNAVSAWLSRLVKRARLPQKLMLVHQFTPNMIRRKQRLVGRPGLALALNVDGFGGRADKRQKYVELARQERRFGHGIKLFYGEDTQLLEPRGVLGLRPPPDVVVYE